MIDTNDRRFPTLWGEALVVTDRAAYVSDMVLSSMWGDPEGAEIPQERVDYIGRIWDVAHMTMRDICKEAHLTQKAVSTMFCIPHRTFQGWCLGERECPHYVRLMMARLLNLL